MCGFDDHVNTTFAILYCSTCQIHFCEKCKTLHDKVRGAQEHEMYSSETKDMEKKLDEKGKHCKLHSGNKITLWCYDCKISVCDECCSDEHQLCDISTRVRHAEIKMKDMERELKSLTPTIRSKCDFINENESNLHFHNDGEPFSVKELLRLKTIQCAVDAVYLQCLYLQNDLKLLFTYGFDIEILASLNHLNTQWENIRMTTVNIKPRPGSSSSSERSSVFGSSSLKSADSASSYFEEKNKNSDIYQNIPSDFAATHKMRNAAFCSEEENMYINELPYGDTEEVHFRKPLNQDARLFNKKLTQLDVEFRITGMTLLDDVIVVASRSAGLCAGYSYEAPGKQTWIIREKLNGPFDLDSYRSEKDKQYLFISDPGQTDESKSAVRVFVRKKNERYKYSKDLTTACYRPKGVCVYAERVYVCEPELQQVTEYSTTGKLLVRYKEHGILKEPIYVAAQVINEIIFLIISDNQIGLKRLVKGEDTGGAKYPPWAVSKESSFTPSKCFTTKRSGKSEVFVGNSSGHMINLIDFESRQVNHREYRLNNGCFGPVAVGINISDQAVVACKDGTIILYEMNEEARENNFPVEGND